MIGYIIAGADIQSNDAEQTSVQTIIISFSTLIGTFIVIWIFTSFVENIKFKTIGFQTTNVIKESLTGFGFGAAAICLGFIILYLTKNIKINRFDYNLNEIILTISIFIFVAISEEILVRGYILRNLMVSFNKYFALIISSLLFSLLHLFNPNISTSSFISLFFAGLLYGITYIFNYRLWFPISIHFSWNFLQSILGFNVSGNHHYLFTKLELLGNDFITGGSFGFEGSIFSIIIQGIFIIGILIYYKKLTTTKCKCNAGFSG